LPKGELEAKLPSPAVITCNEPIPLRLIVRSLSQSPEQLFLTSFQLNVIGSTVIRAMDVVNTEIASLAMIKLNSLAIPLGNPHDPLRSETVIDQKLWNNVPLPNTVAPSFSTCNLARRYELEVQVGLGYGNAGNIQVSDPHPSVGYKM
jgi:hypothetical protein